MAVKREKPPPTDPTTKRPPARAGAEVKQLSRIAPKNSGTHADRARQRTAVASDRSQAWTQDPQDIQDTHERPYPGREEDSSVSCVNREEKPESEFQRFIRRAAERSAGEVVKFRDRPGEYRSPALLFARILKGRPSLRVLMLKRPRRGSTLSSNTGTPTIPPLGYNSGSLTSAPVRKAAIPGPTSSQCGTR